MPLEVAPNTPVADALQGLMVPKLTEIGLATDSDAAGIAELIILMLANQNSEDQIAREIAVDFCSLPADDPTVGAFSKWLFEQMGALEAQMNGGQPAGGQQESGEMDTDMNATDPSGLNA